MNLVDSSGWLEYFAGAKNAGFFADALANSRRLIVPSICIYEVFKRLLIQLCEDDALKAMAAMYQGKVVVLDEKIAIAAAHISIEEKISMADSIILATARAHQAIIWTQDSDFQHLPGVKFISK